MSNLDELKRYLRDEVAATTKKSKGKFYVCPICGSGTGKNGTGAFSIDKDGTRWKCFACDKGGDIFDLYEMRDGLSKSDAARAVMAKYGGGSSPRRATAAEDFSASSTPRESRPAKPAGNASATAEQPRDYAAEITRFAAALEGSAGAIYLTGRGLTSETMKRFNLGYNVQRGTVTIPYNREGSYYGQRSIDANATGKHYNLAGVNIPLFNAAALYSAGVCFVVESPLCAISIAQEGGAAVAISGTSGEGRLLAQLKKKPTTAALVIALDNDEAGKAAAAKLDEALTAEGVYHLQANIAGEYKDPNERLQHDAEGLRTEIIKTVEAVELARDAARQEQIAEYQQESAAGYIKAFTDGIAASIDTPAIPTGFNGLDKLLEGGLYEGLYVLGAISSLGKTSLALQMADQIAAGGHDVIIFSLEMARNELIAKSISRLTYKAVMAGDYDKSEAKTTRGITAGKRYAGYSDKEIQLIERATQDYSEAISGHLWLMEGIGDMGAAHIRDAVKRHIALTGRRPVIVIDYLQILAPYDVRATDKQNTDKAVLELKRISRDYKIPVIGISSFNRESYSEPVGMSAFKESGAIEYGSDVLIGLQYQGMDYQEGESDGARQKRIRALIKANMERARKGEGQEIELKILKNRNGGRGTSDPLTFYAMFNCFVEHEAGFTVVDDMPDVFKGSHKRR